MIVVLFVFDAVFAAEHWVAPPRRRKETREGCVDVGRSVHKPGSMIQEAQVRLSCFFYLGNPPESKSCWWAQDGRSRRVLVFLSGTRMVWFLVWNSSFLFLKFYFFSCVCVFVCVFFSFFKIGVFSNPSFFRFSCSDLFCALLFFVFFVLLFNLKRAALMTHVPSAPYPRLMTCLSLDSRLFCRAYSTLARGWQRRIRFPLPITHLWRPRITRFWRPSHLNGCLHGCTRALAFPRGLTAEPKTKLPGFPLSVYLPPFFKLRSILREILSFSRAVPVPF